MRSLFVAASLMAALCLGSPWTASAQEPERPPTPTPTPEASPPPQAQPRERAVSRAERVREAQDRVVVAEPGQTRRESQPAREAQANERSGRDRREPAAVRENLARENRTGDEGSRRRIPAVETAAPPAAAAASVTDDQGARRGAVRRPPSDSRGGGSAGPRDRAVARTSPPPDRDRGRDRVYVYRDYWGYGSYYDPFSYGGLHLGYLAYSPWGWTPAFYGHPYGYGGGYGGYYQGRGWDVGRVRLKVAPRDAEVYVDGYFAGTVDDFDGVFQALRLDSGGYRIEIRKPGFETLHFDVRVQPDRTITFRGELKANP